MSFQLLVFDSRRGNNEGEEEDKVLGFYPDSTPLGERVSLAGLLQGLHIFSGSLERPQTRDKFGIIETDASIWATFEAESGIFLALAAVKTWLPRHVSQENLLGFLMHTHHLMNVLFCGVQYMLEKDETGHLARSSISRVLRNAGDELLNSASWVNRELRNPLTTLGHAAVLSLPLPITLDVHSLCHRALTVVHNDMQLTENCLILYNRCVVWSSLSNKDTAALSALCTSSIFPRQQQSSSSLTSSPLDVIRGVAATAAGTTPVSTSQGFTGLTGASSNKHYFQLESGFYVMKQENNNNIAATATATAIYGNVAVDEKHSEQEEESLNNDSYSLPFVYCEASLKYLLAYGRDDLLILMLGSHAELTVDALMAIQGAIEPISVQLMSRLAQESQLQGGEIGHIPGWRYSVQESALGPLTPESMSSGGGGGGVRASPRSKVSAMTHHARALATAVTDSLGRIKDIENSVEVCARSTQGVWVVGKIENGGSSEKTKGCEQEVEKLERRCVVVREKRIEGDASQSITSIEKSLQTLELL